MNPGPNRKHAQPSGDEGGSEDPIDADDESDDSDEEGGDNRESEQRDEHGHPGDDEEVMREDGWVQVLILNVDSRDIPPNDQDRQKCHLRALW